jgi:membrane-associated protein
MELLLKLIDMVLHIDRYLGPLVDEYGALVYALMFLVIFCETGLVVTPFLPGDSLLFALGAVCALAPPHNLDLMAILGDTVNYWIGARVGPKIFRGENVRFLNKKHLDRAHEFYERYGGKTIIIARFMPIVRTFAPFVAGMGKMTYPRFMTYNVVGGIVWVVSFLLLGFFFGNQPIVKKNFGLVIIGIIVLSILPAVIEIWREWRKRKA